MARNGFEPAPVETRFADAVFAGPQVSVEGFDPVDLLPERAADKLRALRQRAADLHMLVPQFEALDQINAERIKCDRELKRLTAAASDNGFNLPPEDHRVITTERRLNKLSDELARLTALRETRTATWRDVISVLSSVEGWLKNGRPHGTTIEAVELEPPKLAKGESGLLDQIENRRRRVRELRADLARIEAAPFPSSFAKQRMREQVEQLGAARRAERQRVDRTC